MQKNFSPFNGERVSEPMKAHMSILALKEKGENKSYLEQGKKFQETLQRVSQLILRETQEEGDESGE